MNENRELRDEELNAVAGGLSCVSGRHFATVTLSTGSSSPPPNPWQEWIQAFFGGTPG